PCDLEDPGEPLSALLTEILRGLYRKTKNPPFMKNLKEREMAKGNTCPACGQGTFHKEGPYYQCSECKAVGWWGEPEGPGEGSGAECPDCGERKVRRLYTNVRRKFAIQYCYGCKATV